MPHAIRIHKPGGPEVLSWEEIAVGDPGPGEIRVRHTAVGLNYIDTYHRSGLYKLEYPAVIGMEGAGVVEAVGEGVTQLRPGDRIAYGTSLGAYAEVRLMPAEKAIKLPDSIDDRTAAAMMLQGMTVEYLVRRTYKVQPGDTVLLHAAAGGIGLIASQWLNHLGATVIGTVGSEEKAEIARAHGCHHVINYRTQDFVAEVKRITGGEGVPVVYDGVGKDTFLPSLDCLRPRGLMVSFGNASGPVPPFDILTLSAKGSLFLTRPTLNTYTATRADLEESANSLMNVVASGAVKIEVNQTYPLREAAQAHRDLESRRTTGSTVLLV
jgi:NADPH2:quinone reductase